jgi:hypothetical protein
MLGMHMMRKLVSRLCPELCRKIAVIPTNNIYIFPLISSIANPNISPSLTLWLFSTLPRASTCQKALCNLSGSTKASTHLDWMSPWENDTEIIYHSLSMSCTCIPLTSYLRRIILTGYTLSQKIPRKSQPFAIRYSSRASLLFMRIGQSTLITQSILATSIKTEYTEYHPGCPHSSI